jgi:hypothetical protein
VSRFVPSRTDPRADSEDSLGFVKEGRTTKRLPIDASEHLEHGGMPRWADKELA